MTAPNYSTNLTTLADFETSKTISTEFTGYTATAKGDNQDSDFPIQGSNHASAEQRNASTGSLAVDNGSNITWTSGWGFFLWGVFLAPAAVNSDANAGIEMAIGSAITAFHRWTVGGNDFGRYPYGGWQNFVVNPEVSTGRTTTGAPGTNYRWVGMLCDVISAISKGSPYGIDVVRYGRGDIEIIYGETSDYGTFVGMASANDASTAKWGLFQEADGSYLWKGLLSFGITATAVDFRDSNRNIVIDNTRRVLSSFNRIEINHASSNIEWTNINITALGTVSKGEFEMIANASLDFDTCVFTDMSTFVFLSNATVLDTTFRRCGLITQGGATLTSCLFDESTATKALTVDDASSISYCEFLSDGTGYAMEGFSSAGDYTLSGCLFSGYASSDGTTGNECIHVLASSDTVNINITNGGDTPTIHTAGATVNVINAVTISIYIKDAANTAVEGASVAVYKSSDDTQLMNELSAAGTGLATESFNYTGSTDVYIRVRKSSTGTRYIPVLTTGTIGSSGLTLTVVLNEDGIAL